MPKTTRKPVPLSNADHPDRQLAIDIMESLDGIAWTQGEHDGPRWYRLEDIITNVIHKDMKKRKDGKRNNNL